MKILDMPVEIQGGVESSHPVFGVEDYRNVGGYSLFEVADHQYFKIRLKKHGVTPDAKSVVFSDIPQGEAEYARLLAFLTLREQMQNVLDLHLTTGLIPSGAAETILEGNIEAIGILADHLQEEGQLYEALIIRSLYHRFQGQHNICERIGEAIAWMNTEVIYKGKQFQATGYPKVALVVPGKYVTTLSISLELAGQPLLPRNFRIGEGALYESYNVTYIGDSYNMVRTGEITKITNKTVVLKDYHETHVLKIPQFVEKNHKFDLDKVGARNRNWSD